MYKANKRFDAGYAFFLSPNQTPYRDMYFLEKLSGLGVNDGVQINAVFAQLFFIMGLWPCIYAALLIPSARSGNSASDQHTVCDGCLASVLHTSVCWVMAQGTSLAGYSRHA